MDKVRMTLIGLDGNAFNLLGTFQANARRQGWPREKIQAVVAKATAGNYDHLIATLADHVEEPAGEKSGAEAPEDILAVFSAEAVRHGWSKEDIQEVFGEAAAGNHDALLQALAKFGVETVPNEFEDDEESSE